MLTLLSKFEARDAPAAHRMTELLIEMRSNVVSEAGYLSYQILSSADDDRSVWILESWETQADVDRHAELVVTNGSVDRATPLLAAPIATARLTRV